MNTFKKIISILLSILIISSFAGIAASAEDSELPETEGTTEAAETTGEEEPNPWGEYFGEEDTEQPDDGQPEEEPAPETEPADGQKKIYSYVSCLVEAVTGSIAALSGAVAAPVGITALSVAFTPMVVLLPVTLPIACILGLVSSAAGAAGLVLSPIIGALTYIGQFFM